MGDVYEYIVDGTSGLAPGGVDGSCIVAGVCSKGEVGKGYLLGKSSDLAGLLGVGPLVDRLRDLFATGGQAATAIAVPVAGQPGGYVSPVRHTGTGPDAMVSGVPAENADALVQIVDAGALGAATCKLSLDGGKTWQATTATPANGQIPLGVSGATLVLEDADQVAGDQYAVTVRTAIGPVSKIGNGPDITATGTPRAAAEVILQILQAGGRNEGTYRLSVDGDTFGPERTLPVDGLITVGDTGVVITWPDQDGVAGTTYSVRVLPPVPTIAAVMAALERPLELYDVEFVHVAGPTDSVDWAALGVAADELWNLHRPTFFLCEARLPFDGEDINDWTAAMLQERASYAHRFVAVCCQFGEVMDSTGRRVVRNWGGLAAGRIMAIPVMRAIGRVRDGGIAPATLPDDWNEAVQQALQKAGYLTAKRYAGLSGVYWGDARTLADATSDYQYIEVLRTVFKAIRKLRIQALKSMYDEVGDPLANGGAAGIEYLRTNLGLALDTMVLAQPQELAGYVIEIPDGQDIVNNGLAAETKLVGIPIIRSIKLYASYYYAGSTLDPR